MAEQGWEWSESARRYRSKSTGQFLSATTARELRDDFLVRRQEAMSALAEQVAAKEITVQAWTTSMQQEIKATHGVAYAYGRGGRNAMTEADWTAAATIVSDAHGFLDGFARDLADGLLTPGQITSRATMYASAAVLSDAQGRASAWGLPDLDQYPGDGQTACISNCLCELEISETESGWEVYWRLGGSQHCEDCPAMAAAWNPLVVASERSLAGAGRRNGHA